jgi:hypothetical protein
LLGITVENNSKFGAQVFCAQKGFFMNKVEMLKAVRTKYKQNNIYLLMDKAATLLGVNGSGGNGASVKQMNVFFNCSSVAPNRSLDSYPDIGISRSSMKDALDFIKQHAYKK